MNKWNLASAVSVWDWSITDKYGKNNGTSNIYGNKVINTPGGTKDVYIQVPKEMNKMKKKNIILNYILNFNYKNIN